MEFTSDHKNYCSTKKINQNGEKEYLWNSSRKERRDNAAWSLTLLLRAVGGFIRLERFVKIKHTGESTHAKSTWPIDKNGCGAVMAAAVSARAALATILRIHLLLTRNTRSKLLWEFWYQIIVNSVLHGSQDYDRSGIINCRENQKYANYLLCQLTLTAKVNTSVECSCC